MKKKKQDNNQVLQPQNTVKKRFMQVAEFVFDINEHDEKKINAFIQDYFDAQTKKGVMKFDYKITPDGYTYTIERYLPYGYRGNLIIDIDCCLLTGLSVEKFRINPLDPDHIPILCGIPGRHTEGYYISDFQIEDLYKTMVGCVDDAEKPKRVSISATDFSLFLSVKY